MTNTIILFDVDGTLTPSGDKIQSQMQNMLSSLNDRGYILGVVGGGTYQKITWQLGPDVMALMKYVFAECGAEIFESGIRVRDRDIRKVLAYDTMATTTPRGQLLNQIIKRCMVFISSVPVLAQGHHIDFRKGLVYVSFPGMQALEANRSAFQDSDREYGWRQQLIQELRKLDPNGEFDMVLGGQVGIAITLKGWDKTQAVDYLVEAGIPEDCPIFYFGDKCEPTGNDYPLYSHARIQGVSVTDWQDCMQKLLQSFSG